MSEPRVVPPRDPHRDPQRQTKAREWIAKARQAITEAKERK